MFAQDTLQIYIVNSSARFQILISNEQVQQVNYFKYLGAWFTRGRKELEHVR